MGEGFSMKIRWIVALCGTAWYLIPGICAATLYADNTVPPPNMQPVPRNMMLQQQAKAEVDAAMKVLSDAKKKLAEARQHAKQEGEKIRNAKSEAAAARKSLRDVEAKLEEQQSSESAFGKARDAFKAADEAYHAAEARVLNSAEYKEAYQQAKDAADGPTLASLRKDSLAKDAVVQETFSKLEAVKAAYLPMQTALFNKDSQWQQAHQEVLDKEQAIRDQEGQAKGAISGIRSAQAEVREAEKKLEAAKRAVPNNPVTNRPRYR
jgi:DNA repair exonuclease SbcCD ATPase subunit